MTSEEMHQVAPSGVPDPVVGEHARCMRERVAFWVLAVDLFGRARLAKRHGSESRLWGGVLDLVRASPLVSKLYAYTAEDHVVLVLVGVESAEVDALCRQLVEGARALRLQGGDKPLSCRLSIGIARDQSDREITLDTLFRVARKGVAVAHSRGSACSVHTKVYGLVQAEADQAAAEDRPALPVPRLEIEPPPRPKPVPRVEKPAVRPPAKPPSPVPTARAKSVPTAKRAVAPAAPEPAPEVVETEGYQEKIDRLERRIRKLTAALADAERRLAEAETDEEDVGIASAFRSVQGLPRAEDNFERKMALLQDIMAANLELRRLMGAEPDVVIPAQAPVVETRSTGAERPVRTSR